MKSKVWENSHLFMEINFRADVDISAKKGVLSMKKIT